MRKHNTMQYDDVPCSYDRACRRGPNRDVDTGEDLPEEVTFETSPDE